MTPTILLARVDDPAGVERTARAIRDWEPHLDLIVTRDDPRIYEPDATLYAVGLAPETTLLARHKEQAFRRGDLIVVPRSVAIDADAPRDSYVAILHDGTPPYHFRERFIQTWGYEHRPAATGTIESPYEEIAALRTTPGIASRTGGSSAGDSPVGLAARAALDLHLLIGLDGRGTIGPVGGRAPASRVPGRTTQGAGDRRRGLFGPGAAGGRPIPVEGRVVARGQAGRGLGRAARGLEPRVPAGRLIRISGMICLGLCAFGSSERRKAQGKSRGQRRKTGPGKLVVTGRVMRPGIAFASRSAAAGIFPAGIAGVSARLVNGRRCCRRPRPEPEAATARPVDDKERSG